MFVRLISVFLGLLGLVLLLIRFELGWSKKTGFDALPTPAPELPLSLSPGGRPAFELGTAEKQALLREHGVPITFDLEVPRGHTNEAFDVTVSGVRVQNLQSRDPSAQTDVIILTELLHRLEVAQCLELTLTVPGIDTSPSKRVVTRAPKMAWTFWTDKKGTYQGEFDATISCSDKIAPVIDPEKVLFRTAVTSPPVDRDMLVKVALDFFGPTFTLQGIVGTVAWLRRRRRKRGENSGITVPPQPASGSQTSTVAVPASTGESTSEVR